MVSNIFQMVLAFLFIMNSPSATAVETYGKSSSPHHSVEPYGGYGTSNSSAYIEPESRIAVPGLFTGSLIKFAVTEPIVLFAPRIDAVPILIEIDLLAMTARLTGSETVDTRISIERSDSRNTPHALIIETKSGSSYKDFVFNFYEGRLGLSGPQGKNLPAVGFWVSSKGRFSSILYDGKDTEIVGLTYKKDPAVSSKLRGCGLILL